VERLNDHPISRGVIDATAKIYELTMDPKYSDMMTAKSLFTGDTISRSLHIHQNTEDLQRRLDMARMNSQN